MTTLLLFLYEKTEYPDPIGDVNKHCVVLTLIPGRMTIGRFLGIELKRPFSEESNFHPSIEWSRNEF